VTRAVPSLLLAISLAAVSAQPAAAQTTTQPARQPAPTPTTTGTQHRSDLAVGYSFLWEAGLEDAPSNTYPWGWTVAYTQRFGQSRIGAVGEVTANYRDADGDTWTLWGFLGGVRFDIVRSGPCTVFGQALLGAEHFRASGFSETGFAFQPGGGVDLPLGQKVKLRTQADYRLSHQSEEDANFNEFRFAVSVVFGFR